MSQLKFKRTNVTALTPCKITVYQIAALVDIPKHNVKAGDLGGYIEEDDNLSHGGACWVSDQAMVYSLANVTGDALVAEQAQIYDQAHVGEQASVKGSAEVYGDALVGEQAQVEGAAHVFGGARIFGKAVVSGRSHVHGNALIAGKSQVSEEADIETGVFEMELGAPTLTDISFPSPNHLRDETHPRYDERLMPRP